MITQYTYSYRSVGSDIQNIVANSVSVLDKYVLIQTGEYEYTALIKNVASKEVEKIVITRDTSDGYYLVNRSTVNNFDYSYTNEYYTYSNCGFGRSLNIPAYQGAVTYGITALVTLVFFGVIFKGVLFKCLRNIRKR